MRSSVRCCLPEKTRMKSVARKPEIASFIWQSTDHRIARINPLNLNRLSSKMDAMCLRLTTWKGKICHWNRTILQRIDESPVGFQKYVSLFDKWLELILTIKPFRYPLHYAFVKEGSDHNSSAIDPVEVVALLLEAMDGQKVDEPDSFGCTPLHYAAFRGATVSCLLLLQVQFWTIFSNLKPFFHFKGRA